MTDDLRICHMIGSLRYGGAERQFVHLMNHLEAGARCSVVLSEPTNSGFYDQLGAGIQMLYEPIKLRRAPMHLKRIAQFLKENRINVLQTHMYWANLYGVIAARMAHVPVVVTTEHGRNPWKKSLHTWIERNVITRFSDKRVCVSKDIMNVRRDHDGIPESAITCIPNCVEIPEHVTRIEHDKFSIGVVGRFIAAKDYSGLLKAAAVLKGRGADFELTLLGDGPLRGELEAERAALGLETHVHMPGFQKHIHEWLQRFDCFVISSVREGQPLVLLEAMAYGLSIVATRVGGIPDTIKDGLEGLLVEPGNPVDLADAVQWMMNHKDQAFELGRNARERVRAEFSAESVCGRYGRLYGELLGSKIRSS